jgi:hypothetical protein
MAIVPRLRLHGHYHFPFNLGSTSPVRNHQGRVHGSHLPIGPILGLVWPCAHTAWTLETYPSYQPITRGGRVWVPASGAAQLPPTHVVP